MTTANPNDTEWIRLVEHLPARVRSHLAAARNSQIRLTAYREQMVEEGMRLKAQVRRLNTIEGVNPNLIARCLGVTRSRVLELLGRK